MVVALLIALVGQGWNVLGGYGGQYSFGHAAFFGTGAYATAILQVRYGVNAWAGLACGIAAGTLVGGFIGALSFRSGLRGSYFALVTLAFAEVLRIIASVAPITGARRRHAGQARPARCEARVPVPEPRAVLLDHPRLRGGLAADRETARAAAFGAYLVAVRENEDAAQALGIDTVRVKLAAMMLSAAHHRGGRLLLHAVFPVRRCRHRLRHLDLGRGAARADHRRHRHRVRAAARRACRACARRGHQAGDRPRAGARPGDLRLRAGAGRGVRAARHRGHLRQRAPRLAPKPERAHG